MPFPRSRLLTLRRVSGIIVLPMCVYVFLYTNTVQEVRSSRLYHMIEEDLKAVWMGNIRPSVGHTLPPQRSKQDMYIEEYLSKIRKNETVPILTLFTSWINKPEKYLVHNLTSINWLSLKPYVIPAIFTNEATVSHACAKLGWKVYPVRVAAADGIPVLKYMYFDIMNALNSTFYGYANSDILFTHQLVETLVSMTNITDLTKPTLLSGRRINVEDVQKEETSTYANISKIAKERGTLFGGNAEDYFITQRTYPWKYIPEVVIGRRAYDNWLIYNARKSKHELIDITGTCLAVHQTTASGNHEGHSATNGHYNYNMLRRLYRRINYAAGSLDCASNYTEYVDDVITLRSRHVGKQCFV